MEPDLVIVQGDIVQILQDKSLGAVAPGKNAGKEKAQRFAVRELGAPLRAGTGQVQVDHLETGQTEVFQNPFYFGRGLGPISLSLMIAMPAVW